VSLASAGASDVLAQLSKYINYARRAFALQLLEYTSAIGDKAALRRHACSPVALYYCAHA